MAHPLAQPTKFDKIPLQPPDLPIQEKVAPVHQTDHNVGADDAIPRFQELAVGFKRLVLSVGQASDEQGLFAVFFPNNTSVVADVVLVIFQQLLLTGPCHVGQFDFGFLGRGRGHRAFDDVLFTGTCRLHHLVNSAVALVQKAVAEKHRAGIDDERFLVREQLCVVAVRRDKSCFCHHRF